MQDTQGPKGLHITRSEPKYIPENISPKPSTIQPYGPFGLQTGPSNVPLYAKELEPLPPNTIQNHTLYQSVRAHLAMAFIVIIVVFIVIVAIIVSTLDTRYPHIFLLLFKIVLIIIAMTPIATILWHYM